MTLTCCPFRDDAQTAGKPLGPQPPPKFGPHAAAGRPLCFESYRECVKRTLADAEHVGAGAADDLADRLARQSSAAHDVLYRDTIALQREDRVTGLLASLPTFELPFLGSREHVWIDATDANGLADLPHMTTHGIKEGGARVLKEMPAIGDLYRHRRPTFSRLRITAAPVTRNDLDAWMRGKPCADGRHLTVRKKIDDLSAFQITDDRAVAMSPPPRPVINPNNSRQRQGWERPLADDPEQSVLADRHH